MTDTGPYVLDELPDSGRVVIAHPTVEARALRYAGREGLDVVLSDLASPTHIYVMDLDAILAPPSRSPLDG